MYAVFILWPVPAENRIFKKKKKKKGIRTAKDHNRPSGLYSCTDQKEVLTFYLRSNSQWITVAVLRKRLRSAAKQGQQKDTL